jgi:hypothetical protein
VRESKPSPGANWADGTGRGCGGNRSPYFFVCSIDIKIAVTPINKGDSAINPALFMVLFCSIDSLLSIDSRNLCFAMAIDRRQQALNWIGQYLFMGHTLGIELTGTEESWKKIAKQYETATPEQKTVLDGMLFAWELGELLKEKAEPWEIDEYFRTKDYAYYNGALHPLYESVLLWLAHYLQAPERSESNG